MMDKELKKKFTAFPTSLYNMDWVAKAADKGHKEFLKIYNDAVNPSHHITAGNRTFAFIYYAAFEYALNTFFRQVLDDAQTLVELDIRDLENIIAKLNEQIK